ncbi:MAG: hypothetical protein WC908_01275 [Candidatus Paceibacterota bacterium]
MKKSEKRLHRGIVLLVIGLVLLFVSLIVMIDMTTVKVIHFNWGSNYWGGWTKDFVFIAGCSVLGILSLIAWLKRSSSN